MKGVTTRPENVHCVFSTLTKRRHFLEMYTQVDLVVFLSSSFNLHQHTSLCSTAIRICSRNKYFIKAPTNHCWGHDQNKNRSSKQTKRILFYSLFCYVKKKKKRDSIPEVLSYFKITVVVLQHTWTWAFSNLNSTDSPSFFQDTSLQ